MTRREWAWPRRRSTFPSGIFVMDVHDDEHEPAVVINPKLERLGEEIELREGCLSVPGMVGEIVRTSEWP